MPPTTDAPAPPTTSLPGSPPEPHEPRLRPGARGSRARRWGPLALVAILGSGFLLARPSPADRRATPPGGATTDLSDDSERGGGRQPAGHTTATGLEPGLVAAFGQARRAAADAGHTLTINSGFRTPSRQRELLEEAIERYGSREAALRWVFEPDVSMHVQGLAVDVGDRPAARWLDGNGDRFGLCRTLAWEWWHFEWRPGWERAGDCPDPVDDPDDAPTVASGP